MPAWKEEKIILTLRAHANWQTFLQTAVLTAVAVKLGDGAVTCSPTGIAQLFANAALEEALAALTADGAIVTTCKLWQYMQVTLCRPVRGNKTQASVSLESPQQHSGAFWLCGRHLIQKIEGPTFESASAHLSLQNLWITVELSPFPPNTPFIIPRQITIKVKKLNLSEWPPCLQKAGEFWTKAPR